MAERVPSGRGLAIFWSGEKMAYRHNHMARQEPKEEVPPVSEIFPQVSDIVFQMTYYQNLANPILMERTVNFYPESEARFNLKCMVKDCEDGGFDLTPVVARLVKNRKKSAKGKMACTGTNKALAPDHESISYEITVRYRKKSK
jgi:hypothetical protein